MTQVIRSLDEISTLYSVFEKDQVLTHDQLNSIANYLDDQNRLSRVKLLGIGIVCGLAVSLKANVVRVKKGVGISSDGDILYYAQDMRFDQFLLYDESNPAYSPFFAGGDPETGMIKVYELLPKGVTDLRALPLNQFKTQTGNALNNMVALLFMESYVKDDDLCSATDCDNLGKDCVNTIKLLLVDQSDVGQLTEKIETAHQVFEALNEVVAARVPISSSINNYGKLVKRYQATCNTTHAEVIAELAVLSKKGGSFLKAVFDGDPVKRWATSLKKIKASMSDANEKGIQYYYDFLKDLVETLNDFRDSLFGENTVCCPDPLSFPKHLLLGHLAPDADTNKNRTTFYPSPLVQDQSKQLKHAAFKLQKLDTLIRTFKIPGIGTSPLRITPSLFEDQNLETRAMPYYYAVTKQRPIHEHWNYALTARGMAPYNYGYHAAAYKAQGGAAKPLTSQIGRFSFFRIEGHLGRKVESALSAIENEIQSNNLPFAVRAVFIGNNRGKIVKKPNKPYSDLHRFHYLLRQDLVYQLDEVSQFSTQFKNKVDTAVATNIVSNSSDNNDGATVKDIAAGKNMIVSSKTTAAKTKLNLNYVQYQADTSWKSDINDTIKAAGEFKYQLGKVAKTEFTTPFDSLIANRPLQWIDWLDGIIKDKADKADEKLLFSKFISEHPGLEHFGGVTRGGTFILVYDGSSTVVADFMLPYLCCETEEEAPEEPPLEKPTFRPDWVLNNGLQIIPSRNSFVAQKLDLLKTDLVFNFDQKFETQTGFFNVFKDSVNLMGNFVGGQGQIATNPAADFNDAMLGLKVNEAQNKRDQVLILTEQAAQAGLTQVAKTQREAAAKGAQKELALLIESTTQYVADSGAKTATGGEGYKAMLALAKGMDVVTDAGISQGLRTNIGGIQNATENQEMKDVIDTILGLRR